MPIQMNFLDTRRRFICEHNYYSVINVIELKLSAQMLIKLFFYLIICLFVTATFMVSNV